MRQNGRRDGRAGAGHRVVPLPPAYYRLLTVYFGALPSACVPGSWRESPDPLPGP